MKNCAKRTGERLERRDLLAADTGPELPLPPPPETSDQPALSENFEPGGRSHDGRDRRGLQHGHPRRHRDESSPEVEPRSVDGSENNLLDPDLGSADTALLRLTTTEYADGYSEPAGADRPSAREVSNAVAAQTTPDVNERGLTDMAWLWGQFIDHDIDLTESADPAESFDIEVPLGDTYFDPDGTGVETIGFNRSIYDTTGESEYRQQINQISAFLDGSVIYGSDEERAAALRSFEGGQLATSDGDLLPFNTAGLENAGGTSDALFLAGDVRANENVALTAMQTLWVREHNRIAKVLAAHNPALGDEEIYQQARAIVIGELQAITYNEFLPALLGDTAITEYAGYDPTVDPSISTIFSTASYRFGHSMLSSDLLRLDADGSVADEGNLSLQQAFFAPDEIIANGIESLLLGTSTQVANEIDTQVVDDVRNFLFGEPGSGGFDLASLNIQRGRDHGLPDYNQVRVDLGLEPLSEFSEITSDTLLATALEQVYGSVDNIDVWVGALAEDHVAGSSLGELNQTVIIDQFERIRDGDRYWYQNVFSGRQLAQIDGTTLADVIERNTDVDVPQDNVFFSADAQPSGDTNVDDSPRHEQPHSRQIQPSGPMQPGRDTSVRRDPVAAQTTRPRRQSPASLQPTQEIDDIEQAVDEVFANARQMDDLRYFFVSDYLAKRRRQ